MDELTPMRPVSVSPDSRSKAPTWQVIACAVVVPPVLFAAFFVNDGAWWAICFGALAFVSGVVLSVQSSRRILRENAGLRIPWSGRPPVDPRTHDLKGSTGVPLAMAGALLAGGNLQLPWALTVSVGLLVVIGLTLAPFALHNRRVRATSDA